LGWGWIVASGLVAAAPADALEPVSARGDYLVSVWETADGLPQSSVLSIAQTPDGYLWMATFAGVARFDGVGFTVFDKAGTPEFASDAFTRVYGDRQGRLWASMEGALACRESGRWRMFRKAEGWPQTAARSFVEDPQGRLFVTSGSNFFRFDGTRFEPLPVPDKGTEKEAALHCVTDKQGRIWGKIGRYLGRWDGREWTEVPVPGGRPQVGLGAGRHGGVWVADHQYVRQFRDGVWTNEWPRPDWMRGASPLTLFEDSRSNLWVGGFNRGIVIYRPDGQPLRCGKEEGLQQEAVRALFEDREGNVWVGTDGGGLARLRPRVLQVHAETAGARHTIMNSVAEAEPGRLVVGTHGGGVLRFETASGRFTEPFDQVHPRLNADSPIHATWRTRNGNLWVGTYSDGLFRIQGTNVEWLRADTIGSEKITSLYEAPRGLLWIGTEVGLTAFDGQSFQRFGTNSGLPGRRVTALVEDPAGTLWVGTTRGLYRKVNDRFDRGSHS
jgi:ligand-binding sensor domain-containing protein